MELPMSDLVKFVSCPICSEIPSTSIFQCEKGHTVCESCRRKFDSCLTCKSPWTNTKNILAQELAKLIKIDCKYAKFGCPRGNLSGEERKSHHLACKFRPITCQLPLPSTVTNAPCGKEVKIENYLQHILDDHGGNSLVKSTECINTYEVTQSIPGEMTKTSELMWTCKDLPPILHLRNGGKDFLLVTACDNFMTPFWYLAVVESELTEDKSTQNWATISLQHPISKVELSFTAPANLIRDSDEEIKNSGVCLLVNRKTLNAVSFYNPITNRTEWNLVVSFQNKSEDNDSLASVEQIHSPMYSQDCPDNSYAQNTTSNPFSRAVSTVGSSSYEPKNIVSPSMPPPVLDWPSCADSTKEIFIAVRTNFSVKKGGGVCIIKGNEKPTLYSTSLITLEDTLEYRNCVELEAHNAIKVISTFKKLFTPNSKVYVSCPVDIYKAGPPGSHTKVLEVQLTNIAKSRGNLTISSLIYDKSRIENVAVIALLNSKESCTRVLQEQMINEIILPLPLPNTKISEIPNESVKSMKMLNNPSQSSGGTMSETSSCVLEMTEIRDIISPIPMKWHDPSQTEAVLQKLGGIPFSKSTEVTNSSCSVSVASSITDGEVAVDEYIKRRGKRGERKRNRTRKNKENRSSTPHTLAVGICAMPRSSTLPNAKGQGGKCPPTSKDQIQDMPVRKTHSKGLVPNVLLKAATVIQKTPHMEVESSSSESVSAQAGIPMENPDSQLGTKENIEAAIPVEAVMPLSPSEPAQIINIVLRTEFGDWKTGCSVCVVHTRGKPPGYSICLPEIEDAEVESDVEFEALNAVEAVSSFKKFFTPGSCINILCSLDISKVGKSGSNTELLYKTLSELTESIGSLEVHFNTDCDYDRTSVENIAADALTFSPDVCKKKLKEAGAVEIN